MFIQIFHKITFFFVKYNTHSRFLCYKQLDKYLKSKYTEFIDLKTEKIYIYFFNIYNIKIEEQIVKQLTRSIARSSLV